VRAVGTGKLHASGDAFCGVVSHSHDCSGGSGDCVHTGVAGRR
jgi:hypothetical protein